MVFEEIVVPIDLSQASLQALAPARWLQRRTGARIVVVHAVAHPDRRDEFERRIRASIADEPEDVPDVVVGHHHDPAAYIGAVAGRTSRSVICMATRGHGRAVEPLVGSTARHVLEQADRPVVLVGPRVDGSRREWSSLVACTDGTAASAAMLRVAADWAVALDLALWIAHVRAPVEVLATRAGAPVPPVSDLGESDLVRLAHDLRRPGLEPNWDALHGRHPAAAIVRYANDRPGALLALGTHARKGLARVALGSVAQRVVHDSRTPVLVVRHDS